MAITKRKTVTSKGQRPNVSKKIVRAMRADRLTSIDSILQSEAARSANRRDGKLSKKYDEQVRVHNEAERLFDQYHGSVQWSACVQAVKSNWVTEFHQKYGRK